MNKQYTVIYLKILLKCEAQIFFIKKMSARPPEY